MSNRETDERNLKLATDAVNQIKAYLESSQARRQAMLAAYVEVYGDTMSDGGKIYAGKGGSLRVSYPGQKREG